MISNSWSAILKGTIRRWNAYTTRRTSLGEHVVCKKEDTIDDGDGTDANCYTGNGACDAHLLINLRIVLDAAIRVALRVVLGTNQRYNIVGIAR